MPAFSLSFFNVTLLDGFAPPPPPPPTPSTPFFLVKNSWGTSWGEKVSGHLVLSWPAIGLAGPAAACSSLQQPAAPPVAPGAAAMAKLPWLIKRRYPPSLRAMHDSRWLPAQACVAATRCAGEGDCVPCCAHHLPSRKQSLRHCVCTTLLFSQCDVASHVTLDCPALSCPACPAWLSCSPTVQYAYYPLHSAVLRDPSFLPLDLPKWKSIFKYTPIPVPKPIPTTGRRRAA